VSEERYHGYHFHSRQPCAGYLARVNVAGLPDIDILDALLTDGFAIDKAKLVQPAVAGDSRGAALARKTVRRALALYEDLLITSNVPCFDGGVIVRIDPEDGVADVQRVQVALSVLDNLPVAFFFDLFGQCLRIARHPIQKDLDKTAISSLLDEVNDKVVKTIKSTLPFWEASVPVYKVASWENVPFRHLGNGSMRLGTGSRSRLLWEVSTDGDSYLASRLCADKWRTSRILRDAGLPGTVNTLVRSHEDAAAAARELGWPVVVKPSDQEQSVGVSIGIADDNALCAAFDHARAFSPNVIVEKQAPGLCYRLLVAGDKLIYAVSRVPKSVVGDGVLTVSALIAKANEERLEAPPWKRLIAFPADAEAEQCLAEQGLDFDSIPEKDRRVLLRSITSGEMGGWSDNLTDIIHPDNARLAIDAASVVGLTIAGVDLITTDLSRPWHETGAVVNEINFNPQFMTHGRQKDARTLMAAVIESDGRIPVHLVTGSGDLQARAIQLRDKLAGEGRSCHITGASRSLDPSGLEIQMGFSGIFDRSLALAMRKDVSEMILFGEIDEVFARGLAVDRLERVYVCEPNRARGREMVRAIKLRAPHRSIRLIEG